MRFIVIMFAVFSISACSRFAVAATDFEEDFQKSTKTLNGLIPEYGERMEAGDMAGATSKLLAAFPENTRTPADSFLLGNVFFETDWKQSYALHQAAAKALPDNDNVQWEWALEQHRAGEYAGALATYEAYSKVKPRSAVPYEPSPKTSNAAAVWAAGSEAIGTSGISGFAVVASGCALGNTSSSSVSAAAPSATFPGVTSVAVMISESGSIATWPLYPSKPRAAVLWP